LSQARTEAIKQFFQVASFRAARCPLLEAGQGMPHFIQVRVYPLLPPVPFALPDAAELF